MKKHKPKSLINKYSLNYLVKSKIKRIWLYCWIFLLLSISASLAQTSITSNLPIVVINSNGAVIPNDIKIPATFKISAPDPSGLHSFNAISDGNSFQYEGRINIEVRGASSVLWPKLPFGFETADPVTGKNIDVSLLGMPAESDWILLASYGDKTFIRDALVQHLYASTGKYAPRMRYVELYLRQNGSMNYEGLYILIEKIKRNANRVDIKKLEESDLKADKITGGYIVQLGENEDLKWSSNISGSGNSVAPKPIFHAEYPKLHKYLNAQSRDAQLNYIKTYVDNFEQILNGPEYQSPVSGYSSILDVDAMIDYLLIQELAKNSDSWRFSTFFHKNRDSEGGKMLMGPVWDFDRSLGNFEWWCNAASVQPSDWAWKFNQYCPTDNVATIFWPERLLSDCSFSKKLISRYNALRQNEWSDTNINDFINVQRTSLTTNNPGTSSNSIQRNFSKWNILQTDVIHNPSYPVIGNNYDKEVEYLKQWIANRLVWMDNNIAAIGTNAEPCAVLPVVYKHFEAKAQEHGVVLVWSTASEVGNDRFEIERSADVRNFQQIGTVEGNGNSAVEIRYDFRDEKPFNGMNYYRIRQVDEDGSYDLTSIRAVEMGSNFEYPVLYPNPSNDQISLENLIPNSSIQIMDDKGKIVKTLNTSTEIITFPVTEYSNGIYFLKILDGQKNKSYKILIAH